MAKDVTTYERDDSDSHLKGCEDDRYDEPLLEVDRYNEPLLEVDRYNEPNSYVEGTASQNIENDLQRMWDKLLVAIEAGNIEGAMELLSQNPKLVDKKGKDGLTALQLAAEMGQEEIVKAWIVKVHNLMDLYDVNKEDPVLHLALKHGDEKLVQILLSKDQATIGAVDNHGRTVLHVAVIATHDRLAEILFTKMSTKAIGAVDKYGKTALHYAVEGNRVEAVKMLLSEMSQEDIIIADESGCTALGLAIKNPDSRSYPIVDLLQDKISFAKDIEINKPLEKQEKDLKSSLNLSQETEAIYTNSITKRQKLNLNYKDEAEEELLRSEDSNDLSVVGGKAWERDTPELEL